MMDFEGSEYIDGYKRGYSDGLRAATKELQMQMGPSSGFEYMKGYDLPKRKPKRKLSAWQKYIKNKRNHIKYRDGKLNLKKMGVAFRRSRR